jgi:AGZA family xanthine/uracil permease-like MFS transporter
MAISVGIGLFIALIGLVDAGVVRRIPDVVNTTVPVQLGANGTLNGWPVLVFALGLLLMIALYVRKVKGAILISIIAAAVLSVVIEAVVHVGPSVSGNKVNPNGWGLNVPALPDKIVSFPDFGLLGHFSLFGAFGRVGVTTALLFIFTLMLADFFDTMGTMTAIGAEAGLNDEEGIPPNSQRILIIDSVAAAAGGAASISSNTSYIESAAGVGSPAWSPDCCSSLRRCFRP